MDMPIRIKGLDGIEKTIEANSIKVRELFKLAGLSRERYIPVRDGKVLTDEDMVLDGDEIILYPVISGG